MGACLCGGALIVLTIYAGINKKESIKTNDDINAIEEP
jgi:hypothetical protein